MDYKGYKLLDKIILVCRDLPARNDGYGVNTGETSYQAYFVDPSNKSQLSSARSWAEWTESSGSHRNEEGKWVRDWEIEHRPVEFEFDNNGFTLELLDCAGGSSQGGKLSFWNCLVKKDDKTFKIGINSEMLLALLKDATFINGVCQSPLIFITQKGKVGLTVEGSETYKQCVADRELKKDLKNSATSKFSFGDITKTPTITEAYLGTITQYYVFDGGEAYNRWFYYEKVDWRRCTLTKLKKPITYYMFDTIFDRTSINDFKAMYKKGNYSYPHFKAKCPKRSIDGKLDLDVTEKDLVDSLVSKIYDFDNYLKEEAKFYNIKTIDRNRDYNFYCFLRRREFGFGLTELPEELLTKIKELGINYIEE